mmetsp:Transcript_39743/g.122873  ORF Transcript_39743/g.122873 Transcript_39743/m.122873 type:complete len:226 (-) Transcript_39743:459-1136(-)
MPRRHASAARAIIATCGSYPGVSTDSSPVPPWPQPSSPGTGVMSAGRSKSPLARNHAAQNWYRFEWNDTPSRAAAALALIATRRVGSSRGGGGDRPNVGALAGPAPGGVAGPNAPSISGGKPKKFICRANRCSSVSPAGRKNGLSSRSDGAIGAAASARAASGSSDRPSRASKRTRRATYAQTDGVDAAALADARLTADAAPDACRCASWRARCVLPRNVPKRPL